MRRRGNKKGEEKRKEVRKEDGRKQGRVGGKEEVSSRNRNVLPFSRDMTVVTLSEYVYLFKYSLSIRRLVTGIQLITNYVFLFFSSCSSYIQVQEDQIRSQRRCWKSKLCYFAIWRNYPQAQSIVSMP